MELSRFYLPSMKSSFSLKCNPCYESIKEEVDEWMLECANPATSSKAELLIATKFCLSACLMYPAAPRHIAAQISKFLAWFTVVDDSVDDLSDLGADFNGTREILEKHLQVLRGDSHATPENSKSNRLLSFFSSLWKDMCKGMPDAVRRRFVGHVSLFFKAVSCQSGLRERGVLPSIDDFIGHRREASGARVLLTLLEYALGIALNDDTLDMPEMQQLLRLAVEHSSFVNDLNSFRVEYESGDYYNLPSVICHWEKCSLQQAVLKVNSLIEDKDREFVELYPRVLEKTVNDPAVKAYLDGIGQMMVGNIEWTWQTARYHGLNWVPPVERECNIYLKSFKHFPSNTELVAPRAPALAKCILAANPASKIWRPTTLMPRKQSSHIMAMLFKNNMVTLKIHKQAAISHIFS